jgi:uncharacterized protein (DUF488 family)
MSGTVFTIGHSTHPIDHFANLLRAHQIEAVGDVRSTPYSRMNPQYNRENLQRSLRERGFIYVYLGRELGARPDYEQVAKTDLFRSGIDRVVEGIDRYRVALMCAEREPSECHRTLLVSRALVARGVRVQHILGDGQLEPHASVLERIREKLGFPEHDLFRSPDEVLDDVYRKQSR